jgi:hypothetical protein
MSRVHIIPSTWLSDDPQSVPGGVVLVLRKSID